MSAFYERMQNTATKLLTKFDQGGLKLVSDGVTTGPPHAPVKGPEKQRPFKGVAIGVSAHYVDGTSVLAADLMATMPVLKDGYEPTLADRVHIGDKVTRVVKVMRIPEAGTAVAFKLVLRA